MVNDLRKYIAMRKSNILITALLLVSSQMMADNIIDEVIWIVGDEAILRSEVEEERIRAQYEGHQIQGDPYCYIPEQLAVQKLFLHQAELDSVMVSESTVSHQVDMRMDYYISQIGSKEKMEEYFRKPASEIPTDAKQTHGAHQAHAGRDTPLLRYVTRRLYTGYSGTCRGAGIEF